MELITLKQLVVEKSFLNFHVREARDHLELFTASKNINSEIKRCIV